MSRVACFCLKLRLLNGLNILSFSGSETLQEFCCDGLELSLLQGQNVL